jgi:ketosteroid isomerase-like protein
VTASRRSVLSAAGAGLISLAPAAAAASNDSAAAEIEREVADLVRLSTESNRALLRGDIASYMAQVAYSDDFVLFSPFGGPPSRRAEYTPERMQQMGRFFRGGTLETELVQAYGSADMVVVAYIERCHVELGDVPMQDWALRVTLVYRRTGSGWALAHRHADPLAHGISHAEAAVLGRGGAFGPG